MVNKRKQSRFDKLSLRHGCAHGEDGFVGKDDFPFADGKHVARKTQIFKIVQISFVKDAERTQIGDFFFLEMQVFEIFERLFHACGDRISNELVRAEKHVEHRRLFVLAFVVIALPHRHLIEVGK